IPKPPVVDDAAERFETEAALTDVLVTIDAAAEGLLRIVQMKRLQPVESNQPSELLERRRVAFGRADVVYGCQQMAGIEAYANTRVVVHLRDDRRELLERRAQRRPLARRVFEQHHRPAAPPGAKELQ